MLTRIAGHEEIRCEIIMIGTSHSRRNLWSLRAACILAALCLLSLTKQAHAQPSPDGYDWVTVGDPGNQPWLGFNDPISPTYGRGSVPYEYRIGRTEVTTAQWVEFLNSAMARPDSLGFAPQWWTTPVWWGAMDDPAYSGPGRRFVVRSDISDAGMLPVSGISWRMAAVLCNWLHNDKSEARDAFMTGAYDVNTFAPAGGIGEFTDQATRSPGAKYWIPSLDEHMKASHYDPHRHGPGQAGWWEHAGMSDVPLIYAPPQSFGGDGTGQANAQFNLPNSMELLIPLGAYPDVVSPWGLLDTAGGAREWTEEIWVLDTTRWFRVTEGSSRAVGGGMSDNVWAWGANHPSSVRLDMGVRLATAVPVPASVLSLSLGIMTLKRRRR